MGNGKEAVAAKELMLRNGTKEAQDSAVKKMEILIDNFGDKYGGAITPSGSGHDEKLSLVDFRSHQPISFALTGIAQIEAKGAIDYMNKKIDELTELMLQYGIIQHKKPDKENDIAYLEISKPPRYDSNTKTVGFSLVLVSNDAAIRKRLEESRLVRLVRK
jgi:hypothetical protein